MRKEPVPSKVVVPVGIYICNKKVKIMIPKRGLFHTSYSNVISNISKILYVSAVQTINTILDNSTRNMLDEAKTTAKKPL